MSNRNPEHVWAVESWNIDKTKKILRFLQTIQEERDEAKKKSDDLYSQENDYQGRVAEKDGQIQVKVEDQKRVNEKMQSDVAEVETQIAGKKWEIVQKDSEIKSLQGQISSKDAEIARLENIKKWPAVLVQAGATYGDPKENNSGPMDASSIEPSSTPSNIDEQISQLKASKQKLVDQQKKAEEEKKKLENDVVELNKKEEEIIRLANEELARIASEMQALETEREALTAEKNKIANQKSWVDKAIKGLDREIADEQAQIQIIVEEIHQSQKRYALNVAYHQTEQLEAGNFLDQALRFA